MQVDRNNNAISFDSLGELGRHATARSKAHGFSDYAGGDNRKFFGLRTLQDQLISCAFGDESQVSSAQKLLNRLMPEIETPSSIWVDDVAGVFPCVPEALHGEPECMMAMDDQSANTNPLDIFVDLTTSADLKPNQIQRRGLCVLALVMALSAIRPISLRVGCVMGTDLPTDKQNAEGSAWCSLSVPIDTKPLDLSRAAWALTDVGFARRIIYGIVGDTLGFNGGWPQFKDVPYAQVQHHGYKAKMQEILNIGNETLVIPAMSLSDPELLVMLEKPIDWVNNKIKQYSGK